jgi:integrase
MDVSKDGRSRRWVFRYVSPVTHRPTETGGKTFPLISLQQARDWARNMRGLVAQGIDPVHQKRAAKAAKEAAKTAAITFGDTLAACAQAFASAATTDKVAQLTRRVPVLLSRPLSSITTADVLAAIAPVQAAHPKQAARVRANIALICDYAIAKGLLAGANPASRAVFKFLLPPPPAGTPHRMMPVDEVPAFYSRLGTIPLPSRLCLQWLILTAARSQEAIRAEWCDIDIDQRLWVVPAAKIKMRRDHKVPLSSPALSLLQQARDMFGCGRYVFPGMTKGSPMNPRSLEAVMHDQMGQPYSVHGLRASFSTWCNDRTAFDFNDVEACLAHQVGNAVSRAYDRSDRIAKRAAILEAWASFVCGQQECRVVKLASVAQG